MNEIDPEDLARSLANVPLFREIQRVLGAQTGPVNWELARQIASAVAAAGAHAGAPSDRERAAFEETCRLAELRVTQATGLEAPATLSEVHLLDRVGWASENLLAFRDLIDRLALRLSGQMQAGPAPPVLPLQGFFHALGPLLFGIQVGFLMGYLAHRVLGQYEVCFPRGSPARIYFVFPNIAEAERELEVDPQQFRLWLALHEVTHHLEFQSLDWTRPHFTGLVERFIDAAEVDSSEVADRLQRLGNPEELARVLERPDELLPMMMTSAQQQVLQEIQSFMSVLEGYAEWTMGMVGAEILPEFEKMREGITRRRAERSAVERLLEAFLGLDLKREQYRAGERFVRTLADAGKLDLLWEGPQNLPAIDEVADPAKWLTRVAFGWRA